MMKINLTKMRLMKSKMVPSSKRSKNCSLHPMKENKELIAMAMMLLIWAEKNMMRMAMQKALQTPEQLAAIVLIIPRAKVTLLERKNRSD